MLIKKFEGNSPKIDPKAFVAETIRRKLTRRLLLPKPQ